MAGRRRAWIEDGLLAAFLAGVAIVELVDLHDPSAPGRSPTDEIGPWPLDLGLALVTTGAVAIRRRWPTAVPAAVFGAHLLANVAVTHALPFFGVFSAMIVLAYSCGRWADAAWARWGWLGPASWAATFWIHTPGSRDPWSISFQLAMMITPWLGGWTIRRLADQRAALDAALANLAAAEDERRHAALLEQRTRIAREMHDVLTHGVSVMVVQAGAARTALPADGADEARRSLLTVERTGREVLGELRRTVGLLRRDDDGDPSAPAPGLADLPALADALRSAGLDVDVSVDITGDVDPGRQLAVYRIVQESLTNVLRHAGHTRARVAITQGPELSVEVTDEGGPGTGAASGGNGLAGMRERVEMYGGRLLAGPEGRGFAVRAEIPTEAS